MSIHSNFYIPVLTISILCGLTVIVVPPALAQPVDNYIGVGVRSGLGDNTAGVINAKVKITDLGGVSLSGRPAILLRDYTEFRFSLTAEKEIAPSWSPFVGGGIATNADENGELDPMLTAGIDFKIDKHFVLQFSGNYIFQSNDSDKELTATLNYSF